MQLARPLCNPSRRLALPGLLVLGPVAVIFVSTNVANAGNLAFNMLFSRWMGPALFGELAVLLTIKLAVLSVLNAVQMAVSRRVAEDGAPLPALARLTHLSLLGGIAALPVVALLLWWSDAGAALGLGNPLPLLILAGALPFATPLCLLRGVALGRVAVRATVLSTQVEMAVRLGLGALAWHMGAGLAGVTAAIGLSILAGWAVIARSLVDSGPGPVPDRAMPGLARAVALAAMPFALLQGAQVVLLDGEVILARLWLGAEASGQAAALSLFQRIAFFACFGLAGVLLPTVAAARRKGGSVAQAVLPVGALFLAVSLPLVGAALLLPEAMITVVVGRDFLPAAPMLWTAALAAILFTLSHLVATGLAAIGDRSGIWLVTLCVPVQLGALALAASGPEAGLAGLLSAKLLCQIALLAALALRLFRHLSRPATQELPS